MIKDQKFIDASDYALIKMYQSNVDTEKKKLAVEVLYDRYQNLIYKMTTYYLGIMGHTEASKGKRYSDVEDFKQEACIELIRTLNSINTDRVDDNWKIVSVYKLRLKNLASFRNRMGIRSSGNVKITSFKQVKTLTKIERCNILKGIMNIDDSVASTTDFISNYCADNRISHEEYKYQSKIIKNFLSKQKYAWLPPLVKLLMCGISIDEACGAVGISRERWVQVRNKNRVKYPDKPSLAEKFNKYMEEQSIY